jgi:hypothetical protein
MKLFVITLAAFFTFGSASAQSQPVPNSIIHAFTYTYPVATKTAWSKAGNLYKAEFLLDEEKHYAFFDLSGELVALTHYIPVSKLSARLQKELSASFPAHNILEVLEVTSDSNVDYFASAEKDGFISTLACKQGKWKLYQNTSR